MELAVGLIELKSIAQAVVVADLCLKTAKVSLYSRTTCPGKFLIILSGEISAVQSALDAGCKAAGGEIVDSVLIGKIDQSVFPAFMGTAAVEQTEALGVVATFTVPAAIKAADIAAKSADTKIIEVRAAQGLGGKGLIYYTGSVGAVNLASATIIKELREEGSLINSVVIPAPHSELWPQII